MKIELEINENVDNWAAKVKTILQRCGLYEAWLFPDSININIFISLLRRRLIDIYINDWNTDIDKSSSLTLYRELKTEFNISDYLINMHNVKLRNTIAKMRLSSHQLNIETGRHSNIARQERKCRVCNTNDIEDEYHFILICPQYELLRKTYIKRCYYNKPSMYKFIDLLKSSNIQVLNKLAIYCNKAFDIRKQSLDYIYA
jgi:hypothetical protein